MTRDSKLSGILHVLLHMSQHREPVTSERLAEIMQTNPVVIRRIMAGLRERGFVASGKGHGGGWTLSRDLASVTLRNVYDAIGSPPLFAIGNRNDQTQCAVEQAVNATLGSSMQAAETLLLGSFSTVTLADLASSFQRRLSHPVDRCTNGAHNDR